MKEHKKLYKAGKLWVTATLFSLVGIALATTNASADDSTSPVDNNQQTLVVNNSQAPESSTTLNQSEYQSSDNIQDLQNRVNDAQQKVDQAQQDVNNAQSNVDNQQSVVNNDKNNLQTAQNNLQAAGGDQSTVSESITLSSDWINAVKNQLNSNSSTMNVDPSSNFGQELSNYGSSLLSQNKYISDPALQKINVKLTADGVLDPSTELEVTRYAISLLNPIREQLGVDQYQITQQALDDSTNIAKQYVADNWTLFNHGTHDFQALYNNHQDGESISDGYLTFSNDQATLDSIHEAIYDSILSMLFGDAGSYWGHMTDLAGIRGWANGIYFGVQVDRNGQVHFNGNMVKIEGRQYGSEISDSPLQFKYYTGHPDTSARIPLTADESSQTQQLKQAVQDAQNQLNQDTDTLNSYQQDLTNAQSNLQQAQQELQQAQQDLANAQQPVTGWGTDENGNKYYQDSNGNHVDGWQYIDNQWYYFNNQILVTNQVDYVPGNYAMQSGYYYFDNNGKYMINGFAMDAKFNLYYFGNDGCAITGLHQINSAWYYFDPSTCIAQKGFVTVNNNLYDFGDDLSAQSGWQYNGNNGNNYYFDPSTKVAVNGLQNIDGNIYYFENNARVDNQTLNLPSENGVPGGTYSFDNNGIGTLQPTIQTGWQTENGNKYYRDDNGNLVDGWQKIDGQWYYFNNTILATNQMLRVPGNSEMQAGLYCFNDEGYYITYSLIHDSSNNCYYFGSDGRAVTGLNNILGALYYFDPSTSIEYKGWKLINGDYYFFNPAAVNGLQNIDGNIYYFNNNIRTDNQILTLSSENGVPGGTYSFDSNGIGTLVQTGWEYDSNGNVYYRDNNGNRVSGWQDIDNNEYYFDPSTNVEQTGWLIIRNQTYYLNPYTSKGITDVNGKLYYFNPVSGEELTGWKLVDNIYYYFNPTAVDGLQRINGSTYYFKDHKMVTNQTLKLGAANGLPAGTYHFDQDGYGKFLVNGWQKDKAGQWTYQQDGNYLTNWQKINGSWYYFDNNTKEATTGWQKINNQWYYFDPTSANAWINWQTINGNLYYFDPVNANAVTGWKKVNKDYYYFDPTNAWAVDGLQKINGSTYYFKDHKMVTNQTIKLSASNGLPAGTYHFDQDGYGKFLVNGWQKDKAGQWTYQQDGNYLTNWQKINGSWYYFDNNTKEATTGWQKINNQWYYFDPTSANAWINWQTINGNLYYFDPVNANAVTGWKKVNNDYYYFDPTNAWAVDGLQKINGSTYYFKDHKMVTNQALKLGAANGLPAGTYHFDQDGYGKFLVNGWQKDKAGQWTYQQDGNYLTNWQKINGSWYYFDNNTKEATTGWQKVNNQWYYFDPTSANAWINWQTINGNLYYFDPVNANAVTGWKKVNNDYYYFDPTNAWAVDGLQKINGSTYYFKDHKMVTNQNLTVVNSSNNSFKTYHFDNNGYGNVITPTDGWQLDNNNKWLYQQNNSYYTGWHNINGKWYCFNNSTKEAATGWQYINNSWYYFDPTNANALTGSQMINGDKYYFDPTSAKALKCWHNSGSTWKVIDCTTKSFNPKKL